MRYLTIIILLLIFTGCNGGSTGNDTPTEDYYKGTQGIEINFMEGSPPDTVYVDSDQTITQSDNSYQSDAYPFLIEVRNLGTFPFTKNGREYNQGQAHIYLRGFESSLVIVSPAIEGNIVSVEPRNEDNPVGGYETTGDKATFYLPSSSQSYDIQMNAIAFYKYGTLASGTVCIDPDPAHNDNDVCSTHGATFSGGQGAPIAITSYDIEPMKNKVLVKINIDNVGGGEVISIDALNGGKDLFSLDYIDKNIVKLEKLELGVQGSTEAARNLEGCKPREIRLQDGKGTIFCTLEIQNYDTAFVTTLQAELSYGYKTLITKNIKIKKI